MSATYTICESCRKVNRVDIASAGAKAPVCGGCQAPLPIRDGISELSASGLRALVEKSPIPVVADFWAPWCGPCRAFAPTFAQSARQHAGEYAFVKVNTQENPLAGDLYRIRGIPTLVKFKSGLEVDRQSGALSPPMFESWLSG